MGVRVNNFFLQTKKQFQKTWLNFQVRVPAKALGLRESISEPVWWSSMQPDDTNVIN